MLFKMLGIERAWEMHRDMMPKPRQLFVTQSRVLAEKVEEYFAKLLESLASAGRSPAELMDIAERQKHREEQGLVDRDEEIYWRGDLPKRYGALKEEHFPMFITYDHVCPCGFFYRAEGVSSLTQIRGRSVGCLRASSCTWNKICRGRMQSHARCGTLSNCRRNRTRGIQFCPVTTCSNGARILSRMERFWRSIGRISLNP